MQWIKHDTNASQDAKLKRVRMKYGLEGYGLYWYCLELIGADVDQNNLTFELEHDSELIAFDTGIHVTRINEMMAYMVDVGLFELNESKVTCMKLLKRLDQSMTSNKKMRDMINKAKENHDSVMTLPDEVMTQSDFVMQEENRIEENRRDNKMSLPKRKKPNYEPQDLEFVQKAFEEILKHSPDHKKPNLETWAKDVRLMREQDNRDLNEMAQVWLWCRKDYFEQTNVLSISKFRKRYDQLKLKSKSQTLHESKYKTAQQERAEAAARTFDPEVNRQMLEGL